MAVHWAAMMVVSMVVGWVDWRAALSVAVTVERLDLRWVAWLAVCSVVK